MRARGSLLAAAGLLALSSPAAPQDIPPSSMTVTTDMQASYGSAEQLIYVANRSSRTIVVTSIRLMECENVQGGCSTRRMKSRVRPGDRVMVHRVRPRDPESGFGFRYSFTWEEDAPEGPTAKDLAKNPRALEVDTVVVNPKIIDLKVGETLDLGQVLSLTATNASGTVLPQIYFSTELVLGDEFVSLEGSRITGLAAGTAALSIAASTVQGLTAPRKGASRVLVQVVP